MTLPTSCAKWVQIARYLQKPGYQELSLYAMDIEIKGLGEWRTVQCEKAWVCALTSLLQELHQ